MRRLFPILFAVALLAKSTIADPIDAVLIVQNHASDEFTQPLSNLGDQLAMALSGDQFNIIDPNDAIGDEQNRRPWGENMPVSSALRLAENLEAQALITAAVGETSFVNFGVPPRVRQARMKLTLSLKRLPKGATVAAVTVPGESIKLPVDVMEQDSEAVYSDLVNQLVERASEEFLAKCSRVVLRDESARMVEVAFGCNFPGADVSIDGVSYGTAGTIGQPPLRVRVSDGLHNLRISYPYTLPFEVRTKFQAGTTFMVVLHENEEGRRIRKEDRYFDALMRRIESSGATDDEVRLLRARGYGRYLSSSYTRIQGMPKILDLSNCRPPDLGLHPDREGDGADTSTKDLFEKANEELGHSSKTPEETSVPKSSPPINALPSQGEPAVRADAVPTDSVTPVAQMAPTAAPSAAPAPAMASAAMPVASAPVKTASTPSPPPTRTVHHSDPDVLDVLHGVRDGVETSRDIVQGVKDIGNILK